MVEQLLRKQKVVSSNLTISSSSAKGEDMVEEKKSAQELADQFVEEMRENLQRNVAAEKARRKQLKYPMNGPCC